MVSKLASVVGVGLLLSVTLGGAIPRDAQVSSASNTGAALVPVAGRHGSSSSASSSSSSTPSHRTHAPAARSSGASPRWSAAPATRAFTGNAARTQNFAQPSFNRNFGGSASRFVRPPTRFAHRHVPIRYLRPLFIAGAYYYPYRYLPYDGPACFGITDNGCQLQWQEVPVEDSDETDLQCVEFCPQQ